MLFETSVFKLILSITYHSIYINTNCSLFLYKFAHDVTAVTNCPVLIHSRGKNICSTGKGVIQWSCDTGKFSQGRTPLEDGKIESLQWEKNSATRIPYDHLNSCLDKKLKAYCKGILTGELVKGGEVMF